MTEGDDHLASCALRQGRTSAFGRVPLRDLGEVRESDFSKLRNCAWFDIIHYASRLGNEYASRLGNEEVMRETVQFLESTSSRVSFQCGGLAATNGWKTGFEFLLSKGDFVRAEKWARRHEDVGLQRQLHSKLVVAYVDTNNRADILQLINRMAENERRVRMGVQLKQVTDEIAKSRNIRPRGGDGA